jgi:4'-phosphopantetheinyl transferase
MVEVFGISLIENDAFLEQKEKCLSLMDMKKQEKVREMLNQKASQRSIIGEILVRSEACKRLNIKSRELEFSYNENDKPYIKNSNIHFNISHSGDWVMVAISSSPVGIDIEKIRKANMDLAKRYFSDAEVYDLELLSTLKRQSYFFDLWTIKEAYLKMLGKGLTKSLNTFTICKTEGQFKIKSDNKFLENCYVKQYNFDKEYKMAVVAQEKEFSEKITLKQISECIHELEGLS